MADVFDVFISYRHLDEAFALQLVGALKQSGFTAWFDRNDVFPAGKFREDVDAGIEEAGAFLFLLSPDSVSSDSKECKRELEYAVSCGKKLIPVVYKAVDRDRAPQELRELPWIEDASFDRLVEKVLDVLLIDKDDWNRSGRWQRLSREWEKNHKQNASLLLRGKELKRAEELLKRAERWRLEESQKKPQPDLLQIKFIRASRRARNRFWLTSILAVLLLIGSIGGGLFLFLHPDPTVVTTQQDGPIGSLRWAVTNAPSNSTITFASNLSGETIVLTGDLVIPGGKHLTLKYADSGKLRISLPRNTLLVDARASLTLFNLSLLGGASNTNTLLTNYGTLTLTESTVSGNHTTYGRFGGGINNSGTMTLTNSTVSGNSVSQSNGGGGGISNNSGTMTLMNSTISGNTASELGGGGIYNLGGPVSLTFCTLYGNQATYGGGLTTEDNLPSIPGDSTIQNSLIAGNSAPQHPDIAGKLTSKGYNLIQDASGVGSLQSTDLTGISLPSLKIDPSPQLNGSITTKTHALLPGSPAIDAIPLPSCQIKEIYDEHTRMYIDQRGMVRPGNKKTACDIGAYETQM